MDIDTDGNGSVYRGDRDQICWRSPFKINRARRRTVRDNLGPKDTMVKTVSEEHAKDLEGVLSALREEQSVRDIYLNTLENF